MKRALKVFAVMALLWAAAVFGQVFTTLYLPSIRENPSSSLYISVAAGRVFCGSSMVTYAGGTLLMTASTTNYVYLNTASSCALAVKTTTFALGDIPIASVVAGSSTITSVGDQRTGFTKLPSVAGATWGSITGSLSSQTDLQSALNAKAGFPGAGIPKSTGSGWTTPAFGDIVALWASGSCSGYLKNDGTCGGVGSGTVSASTAGKAAFYSGAGSTTTVSGAPLVIDAMSAPYNAVCDGITDTTTQIQAALNVSGNIHVVIPYSSSSCIISDVLLVHSNTWLDVDPNTTIYEASGNNVEMLRNTNLSQTISDTNISVTGGIWDDNYAGNPGVQFLSTSYYVLNSSKVSPVAGASGTLGFFGVQWLNVQNMTVVDARNFAIQISQCQDFSVDGIRLVKSLTTTSDGIHVNGPSARFNISHISGATADDFVALNAWDWTMSTPNNTEGDITDGNVSDLLPNSAVWSAGSKMSVGTSAGVYRVNFSNIQGTSTHGGFIWGSFPDYSVPGHTTGVGNIGQINVRNVAINVTSASTSSGINGTTDYYGSVAYIAANAQDILFDGVTLDATHLPAPTRAWLYVKTGINIVNIAASNFRSSAVTPTSYWFDNFGFISHFALTSGDVQGLPAAYLSSTLVKNESGASITNLETGSGTAASSLDAFWQVAEGTGSTSADSSLSANNLTLTGTSWVSQAGLSSGGLGFAGTNSSYATPAGYTNINFERTHPFSISTWFVLTNNTSLAAPRIFSRLASGAGGGGYEIGFNYGTNSGTCTSTSWCFVFTLANTDVSNAITVIGATPITENVLHHVLVTYSGNSLQTGVTMYLDGAPISTLAPANNLNATTVNSITPRIGGRIAAQSCTTCYFTGTLGPLNIWGRALTAAEDVELYANPYAVIN